VTETLFWNGCATNSKRAITDRTHNTIFQGTVITMLEQRLLNQSKTFVWIPCATGHNECPPVEAMSHRDILGLSPVRPSPAGKDRVTTKRKGAPGNAAPVLSQMTKRNRRPNAIESPPPTKVQLDMITTSGVHRATSAAPASSVKTSVLGSSSPTEKSQLELNAKSPRTIPPAQEPVTILKNKRMSRAADTPSKAEVGSEEGGSKGDRKRRRPPAKRARTSRQNKGSNSPPSGEAEPEEDEEEAQGQGDSDGESDHSWSPPPPRALRSSRWKDKWSSAAEEDAVEDAEAESGSREIADEIFTEFPGQASLDARSVDGDDGGGYRGGGYLGGGDVSDGDYNDDEDIGWNGPELAPVHTDHPFRGLSQEELTTVCIIAKRELTARCSRNCRAPNKLERELRSTFLRVFPLPTYTVVNHTLSRQARVWSGEENAWLIRMVDATRIQPHVSSPCKVFQIPWKAIHKVYCREFRVQARQYHVTKEVLQYRYRFLLDGLKEGRVNIGTGEVSPKQTQTFD
jgi:hypothetical protein